MSQINSYLTFNGNCREAMNFYQECLGGKLELQTIGESTLADQMPPKMKDSILHSTLTRDGIILMGTDMVSEAGRNAGNAVSLMLDCSSEEEIRNSYEKLAKGGIADHPIEHTFWGALFGSLSDKYGNNWLLNFTKPKN